MAFSAGGRLIATGYADGTVRIWNIAARREAGAPLIIRPGIPITSVQFNPNGTELAVAVRNQVKIFDVSSQTQRRVLSNPDRAAIDDVTWSPGGGEVVAAGATGSADI